MSMSFSSFTRKFGQTQSRPRSLKIGGSPQRMSKSTSEPMNLLTDESPGKIGADMHNIISPNTSSSEGTIQILMQV